MQNFNEYARSAGDRNGKNDAGGKSGATGGSGGLFETVSRLSREFDGKSQKDLLRAIYKEAEKNKRAGILTNAEIDNFVAVLSQILDDKKRGYLKKIAEELKKI